MDWKVQGEGEPVKYTYLDILVPSFRGAMHHLRPDSRAETKIDRSAANYLANSRIDGRYTYDLTEFPQSDVTSTPDAKGRNQDRR